PVDRIALEGLFTLSLARLIQQEGDSAAWVGIALEPPHPKDPLCVACPRVEPLVDGVDIDKEIARGRGFAPLWRGIRLNGVAVIIEAKRVLLVDQDQVARLHFTPQPRGRAADVLACKGRVKEIRAQRLGP